MVATFPGYSIPALMPFGHASLTRSLNALVLNRGYNNREQVTSLVLHNWNHPDNTPNYLQFQNTYNCGGSTNNGNLVSGSSQNSPSLVATPSQSLSAAIPQSYGYDAVNRLTAVTDSSYSRTVCYDAWGNSWLTNWTGQASGGTPSEPGGTCPSTTTPYKGNQITTVLTAGGYDGAGNQIIFKTNKLGYDAENHQTQLTTGSGSLLALCL